MSEVSEKRITCPFPPLAKIGNHRRQILWTCPAGGSVTAISGLPPDYFEEGGPVGKNYRWTFKGDAPPNTVWPYSFAISGGVASKPGEEETPELTNGGG